MDVSLIFKVAGIGLLTALTAQILKQSGREDMATIAAIVGLIVASLLMLNLCSQLLDTVRQIFQLY